MTRRSFFRYASSSLLVAFEELRGHSHFKLSDLPSIRKDQFLCLKTKLKDDVRISEKDGFGWADVGERRVQLYKKNSIKEIVFNLIRKEQGIGWIVESLVARFGWNREKSYRYIRGYFLNLVDKGICVPANALPMEYECDEGYDQIPEVKV